MRPTSKICLALIPLLTAGISLLALQGFAYKGPPHPPEAQRNEPDPRFIQYTLPPGSAFQVLLQTPLDTGSNQLNDPVEAIMDHDLYLSEELVLHKNTRFKGIIDRLEPPLQGKNAILHITFNEIDTDNGDRLPISAHVRTERWDHTWGGEVTQGTKPLLSTQRVLEIGEYNRVVFGGPRAMGTQVVIPPGEHWILILDQPLVLLKPKEEL
jgi:hypothetical protein